MGNGWLHPIPVGWADLALDALDEDIGSGDLSAPAAAPGDWSRWYIECQTPGVLSGVAIAGSLFVDPDDPEAFSEVLVDDGERVDPGDAVLRGQCLAAYLFSAERTALNFLMHLSGIATRTADYVNAVRETRAQIVDTRKTLPGLRSLQKYAVRCGGGRNHRMGLYDAVMIKDTHIATAGSIAEAVERVKSTLGPLTKLEVECETLDQVSEAVRSGADVVMLDNMDPFSMRDAVKEFGERVILEASGGVTLDTVAGIAATGVHVISVGALTHSAPALPFHLVVE